MDEYQQSVEKPTGWGENLSVSRRRFLVATLATGFALAVRPTRAAMIVTDSKGLKAGEIGIPTSDGVIPAYRAMPSEGGPFPVVLVVQEIFGVHEHIKDVCRRLAKSGYLAVAPELYARQGDVSSLAEIDEIRKIVAKVPDAQVMSDLDAAVAWAKGSGNGNLDQLGITGFCWGGRIVWLYAAHSAQLKAGVAWYGRLIGKASELQPAHPLEMATRLKAPVLGLYGGNDQGIPLETVEQMQKALTGASSPSTIIVYPDAPHAFYADYRASYRREPAEDGWRRLLAWFTEHGVA
ncbi:MAG TPA: dienelactone hydrolase family protein [Nitrospira sp.]|nr:dienelactone hydrolase family protein [Nitrospira sp.]